MDHHRLPRSGGSASRRLDCGERRIRDLRGLLRFGRDPRSLSGMNLGACLVRRSTPANSAARSRSSACRESGPSTTEPLSSPEVAAVPPDANAPDDLLRLGYRIAPRDPLGTTSPDPERIQHGGRSGCSLSAAASSAQCNSAARCEDMWPRIPGRPSDPKPPAREFSERPTAPSPGGRAGRATTSP